MMQNVNNLSDKMLTPAAVGLLLTVAVMTGPFPAPARGQSARQASPKTAKPAAAPKAPAQKIVVHISSSEGYHALHSAFMAIGIATGLQQKGADVTLMLDSTAPNIVRKDWASKTMAQMEVSNFAAPAAPAAPSLSLGDAVASFVKAGGHILMCPHCTQQCGIIPGNMDDGAKVAEPGGLVTLVFTADKVLDY